MFLATEAGRIFGLDMQLVSQVVFQMIAVFILFMLLSYLLFDPVRKILNDRRQRVIKEQEDTKKDRAEADKYKEEYEAKLKNIQKEAELILSDARKRALVKENEIIAQAREEAGRIVKHANTQAELEMKKAQDDMKQQIIEVAALMAGKLITSSIDVEKQNALIEDTLKEMGDETWLS